MLLLTLRGTPTLYYGDEIGMHNVPIPPDRVQDPFEKNVPGLGHGRDPVADANAMVGGEQCGFFYRGTMVADRRRFYDGECGARQKSRRFAARTLSPTDRAQAERAGVAIGAYQSLPATGDVLAYTRRSRWLEFIPRSHSTSVHLAAQLNTNLQRKACPVDRTWIAPIKLSMGQLNCGRKRG